MVVGDGDRAEVNREQTLGRKLDVEDERIARNRGSLHGASVVVRQFTLS